MQPLDGRISAPSRVLAVLAIICAFALADTSAVRAQSLLQSLFGIGAAPQTRPGPVPQGYPLRQFNTPGYGRGPWADEPREDGGPAHSGSYRTLCVRMCDGYYWPISYGASRAQFTRDARQCQTSCSSEARLFYHGASDDSVDDMVDLSGRAYTQIPNAFKYRKSLVAGCGCKPAPWSAAEQNRHNRYAAEMGQAPAVAAPAAAAVAPAPPHVGYEDETPAPAAHADKDNAPVVVRPAPVPVARPPLKVPAGAPPRAVPARAEPGSGRPYYSYDLGRFVFPGDNQR